MIAIVDDDAEVRGSLLSLMRSAGFDARGFDGAMAFLDSPWLGQAACLITDLHMPAMDGLGLQAALRDAGSDLPVIIMTAFADPILRQRALDAGAVAFLCKPLDPEELLARVEATVAGRHA
ncbi:response regulator transcription factor [Nitrospirillum sp. BR 11163]|uniref:response regulator transcription factor n=1 Tax=Nitrospirillum sp. BR 11163 TaxID=3104323 RepID=UPI002AFDCFA1|nr:response regulator [Nitrospirillum sp. BR 11163]MEA1673211.1 response regulator [Nitrospirillum sp. BR 11163]